MRTTRRRKRRQRKAQRVGAARAPSAQDRRQRDHREGEAIERLRQAVVAFGDIGVAQLLRQLRRCGQNSSGR